MASSFWFRFETRLHHRSATREYAIMPRIVVIIIALVVSVAPVTVQANESKNSTCSVEEATSREFFDIAARMGRTANILLPLLEEQSAITAKVKTSDDHTPLKDLLSPEYTLRFEVLHKKSLPLNLSQTIESSRERDIKIVAAMSSFTWQIYKKPVKDPVIERFMHCTEEEKQNLQCKFFSEDKPGEVVFGMRMLPEPDTTLPTSDPGPCNISNALLLQQANALRLSSPLIDSFNVKDGPVFTKLRAKYSAGTNGQIQVDKMSPGDNHAFQGILVRMQTIQQTLQLVFDTANIKSFWAVSELVYQSRLEDMHTYGTDEASFGKTQQRRLGESDARTRTMFGVWQMVEASLPSERDKQNQSNLAIVNQSLETIKRYKAAPK